MRAALLVVLVVAACSTAQPATRTAAEVHDSLVWERDFTRDLRRQSTGRIRRLDSIYARIDARRVEKLAGLDSLLRGGR